MITRKSIPVSSTRTVKRIPSLTSLHRVDGKWRIYDVVAENISVVNNYRAQFNRVIAKSSFEELLKMMKQQGELAREIKASLVRVPPPIGSQGESRCP